MSFDYNSSGLRTQKTVNGETKQYFYSGDLLVSEYDGVEYMNFTYSPSGEPVGFSFLYEEDNELLDYYIYLKNLQGDIIGLIDFNGEIYCTYSYDAWGKLTGVYDKNGNEITNPNSAALRNPLRYRGYYYDDETGLYYLNSRYYNPEWGVFISADTVEVATASPEEPLYDKSLYAYCDNNPIARIDTSGYFWETALDVVGIIWSAYDFISEPSWANLGFLAWDVGAALVPCAPGSYTAKGAKYGTILFSKADDVGKARKIVSRSDDIGKTSKRIFNTTKQQSAVFKKFKSVRGQTYRYSGYGRNRQYYDWDFTHNDIEVYDRNGKHLGSMDPLTGKMYKGAVKGRKLW